MALRYNKSLMTMKKINMKINEINDKLAREKKQTINLLRGQ